MNNPKLNKLVAGVAEALGATATEVGIEYTSNEIDGNEATIVFVKTTDVAAVQTTLKDARALLAMPLTVVDNQRPSTGPILATLPGEDFVEKYLSGYFMDEWETPEFKVRNRGESMQVVTDLNTGSYDQTDVKSALELFQKTCITAKANT